MEEATSRKKVTPSSWTHGNFFTVRAVHWNNLPREVVVSPMLDTSMMLGRVLACLDCAFAMKSWTR